MIYEGRRIEISSGTSSKNVVFKERHDVVPTVIASLECTNPNTQLVNFFVEGLSTHCCTIQFSNDFEGFLHLHICSMQTA